VAVLNAEGASRFVECPIQRHDVFRTANDFRHKRWPFKQGPSCSPTMSMVWTRSYEAQPGSATGRPNYLFHHLLMLL
jgi:hypothetical protein